MIHGRKGVAMKIWMAFLLAGMLAFGMTGCKSEAGMANDVEGKEVAGLPGGSWRTVMLPVDEGRKVFMELPFDMGEPYELEPWPGQWLRKLENYLNDDDELLGIEFFHGSGIDPQKKIKFDLQTIMVLGEIEEGRNFNLKVVPKKIETRKVDGVEVTYADLRLADAESDVSNEVRVECLAFCPNEDEYWLMKFSYEAWNTHIHEVVERAINSLSFK